MDYVVIDVESTGLSAKTDSILELAGWYVVDQVPVRKFNELVKPPVYVPDFIRNITGISNAMVKDSRPIEEVLPEFIDFCEEKPIVGYNVGFDYRLICEKSNNLGYDFSLNKQRMGFDVKKLVSRYLRNIDDKSLSGVARYMGLDEKAVSKHFSRGFHSALFDSYVTKLVLDGFISLNCNIEFEKMDKEDRKTYGKIFNSNTLPLE